MQYKTMVLELLSQQPKMHEQLRRSRTLLLALDFYARGLKASHEAQMAILSQARPGSSPEQIASEALEFALTDLRDSLPSASPTDESDPIPIDEALAFLRRHTPPA